MLPLNSLILNFMDELDDLDAYNGDSEHDMWVDFTTNQYTGELGEYFDDTDVDVDIDNLNYWDGL